MGFHDSQGHFHAFRSVIPVSLNEFRLASAGDVGNTVANGGVLSTITARIAASDIPDAATRLSFALVPATHATDTMLLDAVRISYVAKNL
jgi:hypothetical protein